MKHHTHKLLIAMTILSLLGILWIIWATLIDGIYMRRPLEVFGEIQTDKLDYARGETVYGLIKFCKNRNMTAEFQWTLIDSYMKVYAKRSGVTLPGCHETLMEIEAIPLDQIRGDAYFETEIVYKINAFNIVRIPIRTNVFNVI